MKLYCDAAGNAARYTGQKLGKRTNLNTIFRMIMQSENISRVQIANKTQLTRTTVSSLVDELCARGYVRERGIGNSKTSGRKPIMLDIDAEAAIFPVVMLNYTGVDLIVYDLKLNVIERKFRAYPVKMPDSSQTERQYIPPNVFSGTILKMLTDDAEKIDWDRVPAIGFSYLGTLHWETGVFSCTPLRIKTTTDFIRDIYEGLNRKPIYIENGTINIAYGAMVQCAKESGDFIFINIGEGVGVGRIERNGDETDVKKEMLELGHTSIDLNGRKCPCGNRGCVERYINCKAIITDIVKLIEDGEKSVLTDLCSGDLDRINLDMIRRAALLGDETVREVLRRVARCLAAAINSICCIVGTKDIMLGGGIEHLGEVFLEDVREALRANSMKTITAKVNLSYIENSDDLEGSGLVRQYIDSILLEDIV